MALTGDTREFLKPQSKARGQLMERLWMAQKAGAPVSLTADEVKLLWTRILDDSTAYLQAVDALAGARAAAGIPAPAPKPEWMATA